MPRARALVASVLLLAACSDPSPPPPTVDGVAPASGPSAGGALVTVTGENLHPFGLVVRFGGVPATSVSSVDLQTLTCVAPPGPAAVSVDVEVRNSSGSAMLAAAFRYGDPPTVQTLSLSSASGLGGAQVTITGSGFVNDGAGTNTVTFGGAPAANVVALSDTSLSMDVPPGTPGATVDVVVANNNGSTTLPGGFTYFPAPDVTSVAPAVGSSLGGTSLVVTGSGFTANAAGTNTVELAGAPATGVVTVSDTQITCDAPSGPAAAPVDVEVSNANGTGTLAAGFAYHPTPTVTAVAPPSVSSLGGATVTLTGTGFLDLGAGPAVVTVDGIPASGVVVVSDTQLTCDVPPGAPGTSVDVAVDNANGQGLLAGGLTYHALPTVTAVAPTSGSSLGGASVTVSGSGFQDFAAGTNAVTFGGAAATAVTVVDDATLTCVAPAGPPGALLDVAVANANGQGSLPSAWRVHATPTVGSVTPVSGPPAGGTTVTVSGSGFVVDQAGTNTVTFDGVAATGVVVVDDATLTCTLPSGPDGSAVDVAVSNANGAGSLNNGYIYHSSPILVSVTPGAGSSLGGTSVTLFGAGFVVDGAGTNTVAFDGAAATGVVVVDDNTLTCVTPPGTPGASALVQVTNSNGVALLPGGYDYHPMPSVAAVSPAAGTSLGGTSVTVTGTGFLDLGAGTNAVTFGGAAASSVVVVDDTTLTCVTPAGTPGASAAVDVSNANGTGSLASAFGYHPLPTVTSVTPTSGTSLGGTSVTLSGSGFLDLGAGTNAVTFGGAAATAVVVVDDATLTCTTPAGTPGGAVDVDLSNANGAASVAAGFSFHPLPTVTAVVPTGGTPLGGTTVTVTGTGFLDNGAGAAAVSFGGAAATSVVVVDDATLTCTTPAGTPGASVDVVVSNANGVGTLSGGFSYFGAPSVTGVAPSAGTSLGGTAITVSGTGFVQNGAGPATVTIGGAGATSVSVVDDTTLTCVTPVGTPGGTVDVVVSNANGAGTLAGGWSYHPTPTVTSIAPASGTSLGGTSVTVTGTGFTANGAGAAVVTIGGAAATAVSVVDDSTLTCTSPTGTAGATVDVVVSNANGGGTLSSGWTYHAQPTLTAVSPASATSLGGTGVTLTGSGFQANGAGPPTVTIGATTPASITVVNDTTITCTTVAGTPGAVLDVTVSNANGSATLASGFRYHATPTVTGASPASGTSLGGATVTLTGTGFQDDSPGTNAVTFGGVAATGVTVVSDTTLTCLTPAGTPLATVDVALSNANGAVTLSSAHTYHAVPTLTGVSPAAGTSLGGTTVTLTGTGFQDFAPGTNAVTFGGAAATGVVVVDDTTLTCTAPAGSAGATVDVALSNTNGSDSLTSAWSYHPTPTVTGVAPGAGTSLGGTSITITGTGFTANGAASTGVTVEGGAATSVVVVDDATITCVTPAGTAGTAVDVVVSNTNGSGTLAGGWSYHPVPTVTAVSPAAGTSLGGTSVTVSGTGFAANGAGANGVMIGGAAATSVVVVNDTTVTCVTPAGTPAASVDVVVSNANGIGTLSGGFSYHPLPTVTSVSPSAGTSLGGTSVTIGGTGFTVNGAGTNSVTIGGAAATSVVVVDDATITCVTPAGTAGLAADVVVSNDNGTDTLAASFAYHPAPAVASVSPSGGSSLGGLQVTLNGSGFQVNAPGTNTVTFGGVAAMSVVVLGDSSLTCVVPAGTAGTAVDVAVSNDNGTGTLTGGFSYHAEPTVTSVAPTSSSQDGGVAVTVTGTGFLANGAGTNAVAFGPGAATTVVVLSDTTLTCTAPAGTAGTSVDVTVTNANGTGTLASGWAYHAQPTVTAVAPTAGTSLGGTAVTVSGSGFQADSPGTNAVTFGGVAATSVVVLDDATLTCVAPAGTAGTSVAVTVANDNGSGSLASAYAYHDTPTVTTVTPATGSSLGGESVTVQGTGFQANGAGTPTVTFGGVPATGVSVTDDATLTCTTPAGTAGSAVDVVVSNANGAGTLAAGYTYHPAPTVSAVAPSGGRWQGGTNLTITGTGFTANGAGSATVELGGVAATAVVVVNDTTITCDAPAGTPGASVDVDVSNANGTGTLSVGYRYFDRPTVTAVSPAAGTSLGGTSVTITGTGFAADSPGANAVTFGGVAATAVVTVDDTTITCDVPAGTPGSSVDVSVSNLNGAATLASGWTYHAEPALLSISPGVGGGVGGTSVTLSGTGFLSFDAGTVSVTLGGAAATGVTVLNDTTITCATPAGTAGATVDVVLSNDNGSDTLASAFTYHPPPTLTGVAPAAGTSLGGTVVTLTGTGFLDNAAGVNSVTFDGVAATEVVVISDTSIQCESPAGTPGASVDVAVSNDNGSGTSASAFSYHAVPTLTAVSPAAGSSLGGETITLTGTGFQANGAGTNTVTFGGAAATGVSVVSDTSLTCTAPAGTPGASVDVVVTNTNGSATLASGYAYHAVPTLTGVSPAAGTSLGGTSVTLAGTGFQANGAGANTVTFDGAAATGVSVVNDTTITCTAPAGTAGSVVDVVVANANGEATSSGGWTWHPLPTLSGVAPATGSPAGGTSVTLTGTGFQANSPGTTSVTFGGVAATGVSVVNDTTVTCSAPAGAAATTVDVVLTNDNGSASLVGAYTFYPPPTLTSLSPDHGPETGGSSVTVTGTGFQDNLPGTNAITFGGVAATSVVVVSDTSLTCDAPAGTAGVSVDVVLTNDNGSDTLTAAYTYNPLPTLSAVSPVAGTALGGTSITLTGTGFQANGAGTNTVTVGGAAATGVVVVSDTSLTCVTPAGTAGTSQDVVVSNLNGSVTLVGGYAYHATPTLTAASPAFGGASGGTALTLTGTGFSDDAPGTNTVLIDGVPATSVVVVSDTSITCDSPSGSSGTVGVTVSNDNGLATLTSGYDYNDPPWFQSIQKQWAEDGAAFSFTPSLVDPDPADGHTWTSTGTALPGWVTLNTGTGELSGTPGPSDVGLTSGLELSADDGFHVVASPAFDLEVTGAATALAFGAAPAASEQQDEPWTPFTVRVEDSGGNPVGTWTTPVTLSLATGTGSLAGTLSQVPVDGVATFDDVSYDTAEAITFDLASTGVTGISGTAMTITAAPATKLSFAVQPSDFEYRNVIFGYVVVEVQDASGNRVTSDDTTQVDLALGAGTGTLSGTLSRVVTAGRAVFDDLSYSKAETMDLVATSVPVTTTRTSESVTVRGNPAGSLGVVRASLDSAEAEADGTSEALAVSANGRFVAFESVATNLVAGDTNAARDVFVRDRIGGTTERVSVDSLGVQSNGESFAPAISANGRYVAFESAASNLVAGDTNGVRDVFVHDRETGATVRVSVDAAGAQATGDSRAPSLSASGLEVAFESLAADLVSGDTNAATDVFVHDRATGLVERASVDSSEAQAGGSSSAASLSADGDTVAFQSLATDLVAGDLNGVQDVFVRDRAAGTTTRVSVDTGGAEGDGASSSPDVSADGQVIAFASDATNLVAADTNAARDVFVRDLGTGTTTRVSVGQSGAEAGGASDLPAISDDGDRVVFESAAANLTPDDDEGVSDVFLRKRGAGVTTRISTASAGGGGAAASAAPVLAGDGKTAAFSSLAADLVAGDTNAVEDGFFRPLHAEPTLASVTPAVGSSLGGASVTLTGTGFQSLDPGTPAVFFDGVAATSVSVSSDAILTCTSPAGTSGATVDVVVVTNNGVATLSSGWSYRAAPTVTSVSPAVGVVIGGTSVTVTGTGFTAAGFGSNSVTFGGVAATGVATVNDTTITCVTPAGPAGAAIDVAVTNDNGTGTLASGFAYHPGPTVTAVAPSSGHASGGDAVTLTGTGFQANDAGACAVTFAGVAATSVVVVDDTTITCVNPSGTAGVAADVVVTNDNGPGTLLDGFTYNPAPVLTAVAPSGGSPLGGTAVTLTGTGFQNNSIGATTVTVDGVAATSVVVVDDTTVTCVAPAGTAGDTVDVVVSNGNGSSTLVDGYAFNPVPTLPSLTPTAGTSLGGTSVTLTGTGLQNGSIGTTTVTFDGLAATSVVVVDDSTVTCDTPTGTAGATVDVVLSNGNGSDSLTAAFAFHPEPTLVSVSPSDGGVSGGTTITLSGTGFVANDAGANAVTVGGNPATGVVVLNNTTLTCVTPSGASSGAVDLVLSNDNGSATLAGGFVYNASPTVTSVAPAAGTSLGGAALTVTGTGFVSNGAGVNTVTVDGAAASDVVVASDTSITCTAPSGTAGASVDVAVSNANGTATLMGGFTYHAAPAVTSVAPAAGSALGGTALTITGTGFSDNGAGANAVTIGGAAATGVTVVDDTTMTCTAPAGTAGASADVVVTNDNGTGTLAAGYAFHAEPAVSSVSPVAGTSLGGTAVTITGSGFTANGAGTNTVTFGGAGATSVIAVNDTTLTCLAPAGTAGSSVDVVVSNDNGGGSLASAYAYHPAPTVTSVAPAAGTSLGGTSVTVTGTGFTANAAGSNAVTFGGAAATGVVVVDDSTLTCVAPAGSAGTSADVDVTNDNGAGTLAGGWAYHDGPTVASLSVTAGSSVGGEAVTVTGTGFLVNGAGTNTVAFDGAAATSVVVVDDATITCVTPAGTAGATVDVSVSNSNGAGTLSSAWSFHPTPTVASVSPGSGSALGGTGVTISGTGFVQNGAGVNTVAFGGAAATSVVVVDDNTITCDSGPGSGGASVDVVVTNDNGAGTGASLFSYFAGPTVASVSPAAGSPLGGTSITITGSGFVADGAGTNTVTIDGASATSVSVVDDATITCVTPSGTAGFGADVVVSNDNGPGTLAAGFAFHANPTVTAVSPSSGTKDGGTALTITGTGFTANDAGTTTLTIGGLTPGSVVVVDDTTITCTSLAGTPGAALDVTVGNDNGSGTLVGGFAHNAEPTVTAVSPAAGTSLGGTSVTLTGTGFQAFDPGTNTVTIGGVAATSVVVVDDTTLTCTTPAGTPSASADVVVSNDNGTGTLASGYSYHALPTVSSVSPAAGTALGGTSLTVTGTGFQANGAGANTVTIGGAAATGVTVVDDTTLTCVSPAGSAGATVAVAVSNANGSDTLSSAWAYHAGPTLTGVTPGAGSSLGGTSVTLTGTGFQANMAGTNQVLIDGVAATGVVVVSDTSLTCVTPAGAPGVSTVDVQNDNGLATLLAAWTYHPTPTVTAVSPAHGPAAGGTAVTLTGTAFVDNGAGANTVEVGGVPATGVVVVSDTSITCVVPAGTAAALEDVVVDNANGSGTLAGGFEYDTDEVVDLDDDGVADLVTGAPGAASGDGAVHVFLGATSGLGDAGAGAADVTITAAVTGAELGAAMAVGDLNDDGDPDLAVGAPGETAVYVFFGPLAGTLSSASADVAIDGVGAADDFGAALAIGDLDGDGVDDLVGGAPLAGAAGEGSAYVFLGGASFAPTLASAADHEVSGAAGDALGAAVAVGDVDTDLQPDLVLGATGGDRVVVFLGGAGFAGGSASGADATLTAEASGDAFGTALAVGDVGGDGSPDLIVGAPGNDGGGADAGAAYVFTGTTSFPSLAAGSAAAIITGGAAGDRLGVAAAAGDLDGDGTPELLVGAEGWDSGATTGVGRAYLFVGGTLTATMGAAGADAIYTGELVADERFGATLAAVDLDDDGKDDLVVAAPDDDGGGLDAGRVYVFLGTAIPSDTAATADDATFTGSAAGDGLGTSLAGGR